MYPSTTMNQASSRQGGYGKTYPQQVPEGFTVRVFKQPSIYSLPQTIPSLFERGYQSIPLTESRQSSSNQNWHPRSQTMTSAPSELQKTSRPSASSGPSLSDNTRLPIYDPNVRAPPPSYSIYRSSNDTFVYEASLSSKSEDDGAMTAEYTPSSAFSPAMSTDSITTLRGANTPNASMTDLRISTTPAPTSTSAKISFPLHIPSFAQAQTAIKGIFRSQTQSDSQPSVDNISRAANASSSTSSARPSGATRNNTPLIFRVTETASSLGERDFSSSTRHDGPASSNDNARPSTPLSPTSDDEDCDVDPIARANAEYNAAASPPYYPSIHDSTHLPIANPAVSGTNAGVHNATRQLYPNLPLRSSPEQYHPQATTPHVGNESLHWSATEMTRYPSVTGRQQTGHSYRYLDPQGTEPSQSQHYVQSSRGRSDHEDHITHSSSGEHLAPTAQIALSRRSSSRYVPVSRTMAPGALHGTSPEQNNSPYVPPFVVRERETSVSRVSSTTGVPQGSVPRHGEGSGAATTRPVASSERQTSYALYRAEAPATQESSAPRTTSHQVYNVPSAQSNRDAGLDFDATPRYTTSGATRPSRSATSHNSEHRTSPEQAYMYPSQQPEPQIYASAPSSAERPSNYVSSASTRGTSTSPPRTRRDSLATTTDDLPTRSSTIEYSRTNERAAPASDTYSHSHQDSPNRIRYKNDTGRPFDRVPNGSSVPPSTTSSDPGPETDHQRTSHVERAPLQNVHGEEGRHRLTASSSARGHLETPAHTAAVPDQTLLPTPLREPQRRYSDGDSSAASRSIYGPAYASYSGAGVPHSGAGTSTATEAPRAIEPQPQRRYSDGDSSVPDRTSLTLFRTVRWNENLICPSPIFAHQRRKGWFNRRGDQLWTNDGAYKRPTLGQEYPSDLDVYPEHGEGWMNEQGVRIDMAHRLIPKPPLKSALKQSRPQPAPVQQNN